MVAILMHLCGRNLTNDLILNPSTNLWQGTIKQKFHGIKGFCKMEKKKKDSSLGASTLDNELFIVNFTQSQN